MKQLIMTIMFAACIHAAAARGIHVSTQGHDQNDGSAGSPLRTISAAAQVAMPGDVITVHEGTYRERINPPRGGESDAKRIVYQAAPGAKVVIKGSEIVKGWEKMQHDVWKVVLPNTFFNGFNPFADEIKGDWFSPGGRKHHTGAVYLNGEWLTEAASLDDVKLPEGSYPSWLIPAAGGFLMNIAWIEAAAKIPAPKFAKADGAIKPAACSEGGECIGWIADGNTATYEGVDFGDSSEEIKIRASSPTSGGLIEIRLDKADGELLGKAEFKPTGDWQKWTTATAKIRPTSGKQNICLVFRRPAIGDDILASAKARNIGALWFAEVAADGSTTVWAQFPGKDPNKEVVEVNVRQSVFYSDEPGRNFITVRGFTLEHAATNWAPPTAEQVGLIGTHWSKGWIIEDNTIRYSSCTGITLGKYGDEFDNKSANSAEGYVATIKRALAYKIPWTKEHIGHHVVRNNRISHCEQAGLVGSLGAIFSTITGNEIHDIHVRRLFGGAEQAGIKIHGAIDTLIAHNHIHHTNMGLFLDWMAQGTHITRNLLHDNGLDVFMEVNHGPFLIDHNLFLSKVNLQDWSQGGAYAHNLFAGGIGARSEHRREMPWQEEHGTQIAGLMSIQGGDNRFFNNVFIAAAGLATYNESARPNRMAGNVFLKGAKPSRHEKAPLVSPEFNPGVKLTEGPDGEWWLEMAVDPTWLTAQTRPLVTTALLGTAVVPNAPFTHPDGTLYRLDTDYFGRKRNEDKPFPGPFATPETSGRQILKVWPISGNSRSRE